MLAQGGGGPYMAQGGRTIYDPGFFSTFLALRTTFTYDSITITTK